MKKLASLSVCSLMCLFVSTMSVAGNRPGALTLSFGGGEDYFSSQRELKNGGLGFLAVGYNINYHWAVEGLLAGVSTKFRPAVPNDQRVHVTIVAFNGLFRFCPYYFIEPYVMAGVGASGFDHNQEEPNNTGNINAGLGAQFFFYPSMAFRVDARDFYTITSGRNDVVADAGISFLFNIN